MRNLDSQDGDSCPECTKGVLHTVRRHGCTCHINPPCSSCTDAPLLCNICDYEEEIEHAPSSFSIKPWVVKSAQERLDDFTGKTIEYISRNLGGAVIECVGKCPPNATTEEILIACNCNYKEAMVKFKVLRDDYFELTYFND